MRVRLQRREVERSVTLLVPLAAAAAALRCVAILADAASPTTTGRASRGRLELLVARAADRRGARARPHDAQLAERLERARRSARSRAAELGLPDNASYTRYTDLGRPFVVWNVFATPGASR